jgi:hypothetical protein
MKMSHKDKVEWRQDQIKQLLAKGHYSHRQVASILQIPKSTVSRDILDINKQAKESIRKFIDERLPHEYNQVMIGIDEIIQQAWGMLNNDANVVTDRIHCLALAKEAYQMKLDLLTNAAVIEDAGRFMQEKKMELEQQSLQRQPMEQPPQETKQEQQQEQEPETFNKTF